MGHADASRKSPNDAPWKTLSLRLSRPVSAPLMTLAGAPAPILTAVQGTCTNPDTGQGTRGVPAPVLTVALSWRYEEERLYQKPLFDFVTRNYTPWWDSI